MSFLRHPEIFPSDGGANLADNAPAHRLDEFPVGYSLAGCAPAEPAAASPTDHHFARSLFRRTMSFHRTACCGLTGCLSRGVHSNVALAMLASSADSICAFDSGMAGLKICMEGSNSSNLAHPAKSPAIPGPCRGECPCVACFLWGCAVGPP